MTEAIAADTLANLWQTPPITQPETESILQERLSGWFRYSALKRLYTVNSQSEQLTQLEAAESAIAERTLDQAEPGGDIAFSRRVAGHSRADRADWTAAAKR